MRGDDGQIVPVAQSAELTATLVGDAVPKVYPDLSHGMGTVNADLLDFVNR
ncbi:hypothetical protein Shyhy01_18270 [Streptomyces hygroscopicus subsp. hygroscopicus]|nr:hypothetical protein [Streptomyces hygroscopicus]GLX48877.1 hypothetical protein Shyhy01_18270 [Streptomyces hygroscopicus subsp. hygroscopicus]